MSSQRVAVTNYLASASTVITAVSEASGYPVTGISDAAHPFETPYKSGAAGAGQMITIDLGSALPVGVWAFGRLNFTSLTIQADDAPTFNSAAGSPQFSQALTAAEALNSRIHGSYRPPAPVSRRYHRVVIANQATVATVPHAAGAAFYLVGWMWVGPLETTILDFLADPEIERHEPVDDVLLPSGQRARSIMGYPYITLTARRIAEQDAGGLDAQLSAALALDRAWGEADVALVLPRELIASDAYVMRRMKGTGWAWGAYQSEGDLTLEEVAQ